jgi:hypothetical protein
MSYFDNIARDFSRAFSPELPSDLGSMDDYLDFIIPRVRPFGEDLAEKNHWIPFRWKELRDEDGFHESILHIFNPEGEYLLVLDGNIIRGSWRLHGANTLILEISGRSEMFDMRFMNRYYLILAKPGDQVRKGFRKYFVLVNEAASRAGGRDLDWRNQMERLFNLWRENNVSLWSWVFFVIILTIIVYLSVGY